MIRLYRSDDQSVGNQFQLHRFIESHGFKSWTKDGAIEIAIDGVNAKGEEVIFIERCQATWSSVRRALGY